MSRGTNLFVAFSIFSILWVVVLFICEGYIKEVTKSLPTYGLIVYFSYALFKIGGDLARLKDYPEEAESLQREAKEATQFYVSKGIKL